MEFRLTTATTPTHDRCRCRCRFLIGVLLLFLLLGLLLQLGVLLFARLFVLLVLFLGQMTPTPRTRQSLLAFLSSHHHLSSLSSPRRLFGRCLHLWCHCVCVTHHSGRDSAVRDGGNSRDGRQDLFLRRRRDRGTRNRSPRRKLAFDSRARTKGRDGRNGSGGGRRGRWKKLCILSGQ